MRSRRIILGLVLAIGATQAASAEEYRGTWEQQMACTPDVWRLCSDQIPDTNRIVSCLQRNAPSLSSGCRAVFESNNSMPPAKVAPPPVGAPHARPAPVPPTRTAPPAPPPASTEDDDD